MIRDRTNMSNNFNRAELLGSRGDRPVEARPNQRTQLFGRSNTARPAQQTEHVTSTLEDDNNRLAEELQLKVQALKHASITIHDEVSEHNRMLDTMGTDFDRAGNLMSNVLNRVSGLVAGGGTNSHMCHLIIFAVVFLLLVWKLLL